ncbi:putative membrane protein [Methylobacterium sp. RAS18]|nr:putative membrane protein [Methylobacterium sp. RAS18]
MTPRQNERDSPAPRTTYSPPQPEGLAPALLRNIRTLRERRSAAEREASLQDRIAEAITRFTGSMAFVALHIVLFGFWILVNTGLLPVLPKWDASFVILGTAASVEAIFLSTFVLISQNRMAAAADKRADLDLHISLLAEHEVTKLVAMVSAITERMGIETVADPEVGELSQDVAPDAVLDEIERNDRA